MVRLLVDDLIALPVRAKKCHEFEIDLGGVVLRQPETCRQSKINMSRGVRPYSVVGVVDGS
jgi:hypothetical protein